MIIKKEIKPRRHSKSFIEYVLYHPQAFAVVFRMAIIVPLFLMLAWIFWSISSRNWVMLPFASLMFVLSAYSVWKNKAWFKTETDNTIANTVYNIDKKRKSYDEFKKEIEGENENAKKD